MGRQGRRGPKLIPGKLITTKLPLVVDDALHAAAAANYESPAAYLRRIVVERLRADGLLPPVAVPVNP